MKTILVNIAGRILGPYTPEEVIRNLLEKRFLPIHEILWPGSRWLRINAHPDFVEICNKMEELSIDSSNIEDFTHSLTASFITTAGTNDSSYTKTAFSASENTKTVKALMDETKKVNIKDLEEEEGTRVFYPEKTGLIAETSLSSSTVKKKIKPSFSSTYASGDKDSVYVSSKDKKEKGFVWKRNKTWWISFCVFFVIILGFLWQRQYFKIRDNQKTNLALATKRFKENQFPEALKKYKQIIAFSKVNKLSLPLYVYENYASLLLLVDQDSFGVQALVGTVLQKSLNKNNLLILSYLYSKNPQKALKILSAKPNKILRDWLNMASAYYLQGRYQQSLGILNQLKIKEARILSVLLYIKLYKKQSDSRWLVKANKTLARLKNSFHYRQRLSLISIYIQSLLGQAPRKKELVSILDQDPDLEKNRRTNLFIYSNLWSWKSLTPYCEEVVFRSSGQLLSKALQVFCLSKGRKKQKNWNALLNALQGSNDILIGSVLAYAYRQEKLTDKYVIKLAHLTESLDAKKSILLLHLELRYCVEKQNKECVKNRVRDVLNVDPLSLFALFHRMKFYKSQGLRAEAKRIHAFFKTKIFDYNFL
ncbi:MAG: hypothetical protein HAW63_02540 [Bdellovibrionaceae bacterium]|nr:hypothetical protein [Pseudobdellovibrionaceae bacterium]